MLLKGSMNRIALLFGVTCALFSTAVALAQKGKPGVGSDQSFSGLDSAITVKMTQFKVPGMAIAIVRDEKLVYVKSYGYADKETGQKASNDNLYRIASISKPVTYIAILKLVQEGKLSLDQKVFGKGAILGDDFGTPPVGSDKDLITVQHLLDHTSGWTNNPTDPMFMDVKLSQAQLISDLLANRPLTTLPGKTSSYSNFGYCILGRVIEKISGMKYDAYVRKEILKPSGITKMQTGGNTLAQRLPNEVKYYQAEYDPYSMNISRMDAHGGWVASATDLAKLLVRIDRNPAKPDLIKAELLNKAYFGYENWVFNGSLPGTSTTVSRLNDHISFVMLANTRTENDYGNILNEIYAAMKTQLLR